MVFFGRLLVLLENGRIVKFFFGLNVMCGKFDLLLLKRIEIKLYLFLMLFLRINMWFIFSFFVVFLV